MACGCKKKNQTQNVQTTNTSNTTNIQEEQNKKVLDVIMKKLTV
jgi:hypothetical protein